MAPLIIFDDGLGHLGPMTDLRATFEVRTGVITTAARIVTSLGAPLGGYWVPHSIEHIVAERSDVPVNTPPDGDAFVCVNGRAATVNEISGLAKGEALLDADTRHIVAAHLDRDDALALLRTGELPRTVRNQRSIEGSLYRFAWDILARLPETLVHDIEHARLLDATVLTDKRDIMGHHPIQIHETATVAPGVILDASVGPIVIHEQAVIRPTAVLCGPCSIGRGSVVVDRAHIKPNTVIGPYCKVGGEIGATIFQGYANKAHEGHLGDSWVGKWVNIGAGTTNSNLLNTYGEISMRLRPDGPRHRTGRTFLGSIIGDHAKLAILTRLMTGTSIGTGTMIATTAAPPTTIGRFAWLTDAGTRQYRFEKFLDTARRVMRRRDRTPTEAYVDGLRALHRAEQA